MLRNRQIHPKGFVPTQLVGAAIQATMYILPTAKGTFYLARAMGFEGLGQSLSSVLIVTWDLLAYSFSSKFLPGATSIVERKIAATMARNFPYPGRSDCFDRREVQGNF